MNSSKGLIAALVVLVVAAGWGLRARHSRHDLVTVKEPDTFNFRCAACDHRWTADGRTASTYYGGGLPTEERSISCPSCEKKRAFFETECLYCHEGWLPDYVVNSEGVPSQLVCPHCKKDSLKWRRQPEAG